MMMLLFLFGMPILISGMERADKVRKYVREFEDKKKKYNY
jgi:hypothetical protein